MQQSTENNPLEKGSLQQGVSTAIHGAGQEHAEHTCAVCLHHAKFWGQGHTEVCPALLLTLIPVGTQLWGAHSPSCPGDKSGLEWRISQHPAAAHRSCVLPQFLDQHRGSMQQQKAGEVLDLIAKVSQNTTAAIPQADTRSCSDSAVRSITSPEESTLLLQSVPSSRNLHFFQDNQC